MLSTIIAAILMFLLTAMVLGIVLVAFLWDVTDWY